MTKVDVGDNSFTMVTPELLQPSGRGSPFERFGAESFPGFNLQNGVGSDDDLDQQLAFAETYHTHFDSIPGGHGSDLESFANDGYLAVGAFPEYLQDEAHSLISMYSYGDPGDHVVDGQAGLTLEDLEYFAAEGIVTFREIENPAEGYPPVAMSIDVNAIPDDRLAVGFAGAAAEHLTYFDVMPPVEGADAVQYDQLDRELFIEVAKDVFSFDDSNDSSLELVDEIFVEAKLIRAEDPNVTEDELNSRSYSGDEIMAAMTRLDIKPSDFYVRTMTDIFQDLHGNTGDDD